LLIVNRLYSACHRRCKPPAISTRTQASECHCHACPQSARVCPL
jgi:hypothetical protein